MLISKRVIFLSKEIKFLIGKCYIKAFGFFLLPASFASKTHSCKYSTAGNSNPWSNFTTFTPPGSTFKLWKSSFLHIYVRIPTIQLFQTSPQPCSITVFIVVRNPWSVSFLLHHRKPTVGLAFLTLR